jgi:putative membrane protein
MNGAESPSEQPVEDASPDTGAGVPRRFSDYVVLAAKGFAVGSGNVVPGVSGGTMAFILGIFEELIESIRKVADLSFLEAVLTLHWKKAIEAGNVKFLAAVGTGAFAAVLTLARLLEWLLVNKPVYVWSFFFGLILASVIVVAKRIRSWGVGVFAFLLAGTAFAWALVGFVPLETPDTWWFLAISGALAICAMILPGISGAFVLVLLGKYQTILSALNHGQFDVIALVGIGAIVGLVSVAQILGWLFSHHHDVTVAALTGFMVGSLRKVWPWKETVTTYLDRHGMEVPALVSNVLPAMGAEVIWAVVLGVAGLGVVLLMDRAHVTDASVEGQR